jgi:hypothetical protein
LYTGCFRNIGWNLATCSVGEYNEEVSVNCVPHMIQNEWMTDGMNEWMNEQW